MALPTRTPPAPSMPGWARPQSAVADEADAAFAAGVALKALDDVVAQDSRWAGCWRARQALRCAVASARFLRRDEDEAALRDALALPGEDAGPGGRVLLAWKDLAGRRRTIDGDRLDRICDLLGIGRNDMLADFICHLDTALAAPRAVPFAAADLIATICSARPDAEGLAWWLADWLIAARLQWAHPLPLLMAERDGPSLRRPGSSARVRPGDEAFARSICLAIASAAGEALRLESEIARRAQHLMSVAPKVRTKGGGKVIDRLLDDDAVSASAPRSGLSRWAARRLFERLEALGAVRELSGRPSFKVYGI